MYIYIYIYTYMYIYILRASRIGRPHPRSLRSRLCGFPLRGNTKLQINTLRIACVYMSSYRSYGSNICLRSKELVIRT